MVLAVALALGAVGATGLIVGRIRHSQDESWCRKVTPTVLTLKGRPEPIPPDQVAETDRIKLIEFESPLLSAFWGRPIKMRAGIVLPPGYAKETARRYPTIYNIHGYGGDYAEAWQAGLGLVAARPWEPA